MKKNILGLLAITPFFACAQLKDFTLDGNIPNLTEHTKVYLFYMKNKILVKDSSYVIVGRFQFKGQLDEPSKATVRIDRDQKVADITNIYLAPGIIKMKGQDSLSSSVIVHSKINDDFRTWQKMTSKYHQTMIQLRQEAFHLQKDELQGEEGRALNQQGKLLADSLKQAYISFIKTYPDSYVSLDVLNLLVGPSVNVKEIKPLFECLSTSVKETPSGIELSQNLKKAAMSDIGVLAPDFTSTTPEGEKVELKNAIGKSKLLLLDFWASWCGPCRAENPNVVKAYNQFHSKGFNILSVSLDQNAGSWKAAIAKDGMPWAHVSSLQGWKDPAALLYYVNSIPANFLIDENGKILAKSLRGDDLEKKLKEILSN
ncbi:MAG TPA: TlpA disulfide reductase family protein [Arachidicoccus sp.]